MMIKILSSDIEFGYLDDYVVKHRQGSGVSSSKGLISAKSYKYYMDMLNFTKNDLKDYEDYIGKVRLKNRIKVYEFRVIYAHLIIQEANAYQRLIVIFKNINTLTYYTITRGIRSLVNQFILRFES